MKSCELDSSIANERHSRKLSCCDMFVKNVWHDAVEKFCERVENGCGNGVGRTGGLEGTVGTPVFAAVVEVEVEVEVALGLTLKGPDDAEGIIEKGGADDMDEAF